jgi:D-alanine-D-alanine ligase
LDKEGVPHFLEVNPLAGLHPNSSDLVILSRKVGISYAELIGNVMDQAITRLGILCSA